MTRLRHRHLVRTHFFDKLFIWFIRIIPILAILVFIWAQSNLIVTREYIYTAQDLPKSFVGYKIMHISDIANTDNDVISIARNEKPDIIIISGGYTDDSGNSKRSARVVEKLTTISPVYYIYNTDDNGNELEGTSATNLTNASIEIAPNEIDYSAFIRNNYGDEIIKQYNKKNDRAIQYVNYIIEALDETKNSRLVLGGLGLFNGENEQLAAREQTFEVIGTDMERIQMLLNGNMGLVEELCKYTNTDMLFVGGTFGTNRLSDKYSKGLYGNNGTEIFVSGGIGNKTGCTRFLNLPEVQVITLSDGTITDANPLERFISKFLPDVGTIFDNDGGFKEYTYKYNNKSYDENGGR